MLALLSLGFGLLIERAGGAKVPGSLLLPLGFAGVIVVGTLLTASPSIAPLTVPVVVGTAVLGVAIELAYPSRARRVEWLLAGAATAALLVYGAPILLSGSATFAGYVKLDDTASWLALADRVVDHGRSTAGLEPSSYQVSVASYLHSGYPLGSIVPLGIGAHLAGLDAAWLYQPYLAFQGALLVLVFAALLRAVVRTPWRRAGIAFVAAQPALLYGYSLWGRSRRSSPRRCSRWSQQRPRRSRGPAAVCARSCRWESAVRPFWRCSTSAASSGWAAPCSRVSFSRSSGGAVANVGIRAGVLAGLGAVLAIPDACHRAGLLPHDPAPAHR